MNRNFAFVLLGLLVLAGCQLETGPSTAPQPNDTGELQTFSSAEELQQFLAQTSGGATTQYFERTAVAEDAAAPTSAGAGESTRSFTGTNNQEVGVDEADILKTDGEYVYTVTGRTLFILDAYPGEDAQVVSRTLLGSQPRGLFIHDDTLVVIGSQQNHHVIEPFARSSMPYYGASSTSTIHAYDLADRTAPKIVKNASFEGSYVEARMRDGVAYMVFNTRVAGDDLPVIMEDGVETRIAASDIAYWPVPYDQPQLTTVQALSLDTLSLASDSFLTESAQTVYMDEHLYLASPRRINEYEIRQEQTLAIASEQLPAEKQDLLARIDAVDDEILSSSEKKHKKLQVIQEHTRSLSADEQDALEEQIEQAVDEELAQFDYRQYTRIAKLSVSADGARFVADAEVGGSLNNQFSMDERDGVLRLATTTDGIWEEGKQSRESENHVFTLDEDLSVLDHVDGIAVDERIYSARFVEDRLYLVTFKQVDPFFVIDLSDASDVEVLGELKITGFSRYLHPYDEDTVIGFGRQADERGRQEGLKISLFDVSDVASPQELASWVSEGDHVSSSAEYEHKAFLLDKDNDLLVIPASSHDRREGGESYNGALVFSISSEDIELRGLVDHGSGERFGSSVERSFTIEELLYTKSPSLLRINSIEDLSSVQEVELRGLSATDVPVY